MLLRTLCILALALSGTAALPSTPVYPTSGDVSIVSEPPSADLQERQFTAVTCPQLIKCSNGYTGYFNPRTEECGCVTNESIICRTATTCIFGSHPVWNDHSKTCACLKNDVQEDEEACYSSHICRDDLHPIFYIRIRTCACEPRDNGDNVYIIPREEVDPSTCPTIKCRAGYHALYHPESKTCSCQEDYPPDPSTCPNIRCASGTKPFYIAEEKKCICKVVNPIPPTCPQMKCIEGNHVVFHPEINKCSCDLDCPDLMCVITTKPSYNSTTHQCSCQKIPGLEGNPTISKRETQVKDIIAPPEDPLPPQCIDIMCLDEKQPKFNTTTQKCECVWRLGMEPDPNPALCRDTMCIAEKEAIYEMSSGLCYCEWLPGFFPKREEIAEPASTPTHRPTGGPYVPDDRCNSIGCIAEMYPAWNETLKRCTCVWIPGLEPQWHAPVSPDTAVDIRGEVPPSCREMWCIPEMQLVHDPITKTCSCKWIPGLEPGPPTMESRTELHDPCEGVWCIPEMTPTEQKETHTCKCVWKPGFEPSSISIPTPTPTANLCGHMMCISEQRPVWNAVSQKCFCEWIPGLEPSHISTSKGPVPTGNCKMYCANGFVPGTCDCAQLPPVSVAKRDEPTEVCKMYCEFGFVPGICKCNQSPTVTLPTAKPTNTCHMYCEFGLIPGKCKCREPTPIPLPSPIPSVTTTICMLGCPFGLIPGQCKCRDAPSPTTVPKPTETICLIYCPFGLIPGTCKCKDATPVPLPSPITTTKKPKPTACAIFCEFGIIPGTCTCREVKRELITPALPLLPKRTDGSVPACFNITANAWIKCEDPLESPIWESGRCVCKTATSATSTTCSTSSASSTSTTSFPITSKPTTLKTSTSKRPIPTTSCGHSSGIICIPEMKLVWDEEAGRCKCVWREGMEPVIITKRQISLPPTVTRVSTTGWVRPTGRACIGSGIVCYPEKRLVWDEVLKRCVCVWREGFEPATV